VREVVEGVRLAHQCSRRASAQMPFRALGVANGEFLVMV
jgi:hypothetical protein